MSAHLLHYDPAQDTTAAITYLGPFAGSQAIAHRMAAEEADPQSTVVVLIPEENT